MTEQQVGASVRECVEPLSRRSLEALRHVVHCDECARRLRALARAGERCLRVRGSRGQPRPQPWMRPHPWMRGLALEGQGDAGSAERGASHARALLAELSHAPPERRMEMAGERRFRSLALARRLLAASERKQATDPRGAEALAWLALRVARHPYPAERAAAAEEVKAQAFALAGNARRLQGDLAGAEGLLAYSRSHLSRRPAGAGRASHCQALALLRFDQGFPEEGEGLLAQAAWLYVRCGLVGEGCGCLAQLGLFHLEQGWLEHAREALTVACAGLDGRRLPGPAARARMGLALCRAIAGDEEGALELVAAVRPLRRRVPGREDRRALAWMEGRVAAFLGRRARAAGLLARVRDDFAAAGEAELAALAGFDLALLEVPRGRAHRLAEALALAGPVPAHLRKVIAQRVMAWLAPRPPLSAGG